MKKTILYLMILSSILACKDVFETDIADKSIFISNPADNLVTTNSTITFLWDHIEDAESYEIQVVAGRFDSLISFVLDSNVIGNQFVYTFNPGIYEWRLRAYNSVSSTAYYTRSFQVDSTNDLSQTAVILQAPSTGIIGGNSQIFRWNEVFSATQYLLEVRKDDWDTGEVAYADTLSSNSIVLTDTLVSDTYAWGVKAINATSTSDFNTSSFELDNTNPELPQLNSPSNQTNIAVNNPFTLNWTSGTDDNFKHDVVVIYSNSQLTTIASQAEVTDGTFTDSLAVGTYYWQVKTVDVVDNESAFTNEWTFRVQ